MDFSILLLKLGYISGLIVCVIASAACLVTFFVTVGVCNNLIKFMRDTFDDVNSRKRERCMSDLEEREFRKARGRNRAYRSGVRKPFKFESNKPDQYGFKRSDYGPSLSELDSQDKALRSRMGWK